MKKQISLIAIAFCVTQFCFAQSGAPEQKTKIDASKPIISTTERSAAIVSKLQLKDEGTRTNVATILRQYLDSQQVVFKTRNQAMNDAKQNASKELADAQSQAAWNASVGKFNKLQAVFLGKLSTMLTLQQGEMVKDLLTEYGVKREYENYLDLFPKLTEIQKAQVMAYLLEARENAINGETPESRVDWFIKYRGRANNYLAAAGYDLRKATDEQKARKSK